MLHSEESHGVVPSGFYVTAFIDADSADAARDYAIALVRQSDVYAAARNTSADPPRIAIEEVEEIANWPIDAQRPLTGFALYEEGAE